MKSQGFIRMGMVVVSMTVFCVTLALCAESPSVPDDAPKVAEKDPHPAIVRPSLEEARGQAEILHRAMHSTLQVVHHRYYREDEGLPIPAAILTDVFDELEKEQRIKLRWLAVEGKAMNSDHQPQDRFEDAAVEALKLGKQNYERVEKGIYRRAGAITLTNQCLKCHVPNRKSTENRTAGLIIAIPIQEK